MGGMGEERKLCMHHDFVYVSENEYKPVKKELIRLINKVQDEVREFFTFQFKFIGSTERGMITRDRKSNIGYDFDVNIYVNDEQEQYSAEEIRSIIRNAIDKFAQQFGYSYCENGTRVLTIKNIDFFRSRILHSCDFAIVYDCSDGRQQYIRFNKNQQSYYWEYQNSGYKGLKKKEEWIEKNHKQEEMYELYIDKKNANTDPEKKSRSLYAETVHEIYKRYHPESL